MDTLTPQEVTAVMLTLGEKKAKQAYHVCFGAFLVQTWQGGSGTLRTDYPSVVSLVGAFFFPVGLIMLVLTGQELVTANFMVMPMALMKGRIKVWELPLNWLIVFFGNLAGALCLDAFMVHYSGLMTSTMTTIAQSAAVTKTSEGWGPCVLRGIGCNFLVCTAVWLGTGARETISKIAALHFPVFLFVFLGFEHVVVNMYYVPVGMIVGANVSSAKYIAQSLIPSFIGNVIGALLRDRHPHGPVLPPPALPLFNKLPGRSNSHESSETVVVDQSVDTGAGTLGDNIPETVTNGKKH
ncbi:hypothetical protein EHS25_006329 [Saitozyma podzolica]|uniref:Formate/nitrite transporter n=1 Tax=Saitozyma podzolica TaxID=1890683 RepID=A0A427YRI1_9TREE|nr:hypothetical protein EHS25_006329 [Saitozyma podzolica]